MKSLISGRNLTASFFTCAALAVLSTGTARAQYTVTGTTPGGGLIISATGTPGPLSDTTAPVALSAGGFNIVTFQPGSSASASGVDTVIFISSGNVLTNNGTITGDVGFSPLVFTGTSTFFQPETVTNNGTMLATTFGALTSNFGNNYPPGQVGGSPGTVISFVSGTGMDSIVVTNNSILTGAGATSVAGGVQLGTNFSGTDTGGNVGGGIALTGQGNIGSSTFANNGTITAGGVANLAGFASIADNYNDADVGGNLGVAIAVTSGSEVEEITISNNGTLAAGSVSNNANGGQIASNYGTGDYGGNAGTAIAITGADLTEVSITNKGSILGGSITGDSGNSSDVGVNFGNGNTGGNAGVGIALTAHGTIADVTIDNSGTVQGGAFSITNDGEVGANFGNSGVGGIASSGIAFTSGSFVEFSQITNSGLIKGGSLGDLAAGSEIADSVQNSNIGGSAGDGLVLTSGSGMASITFTNSGTVAGGSFGVVGVGGQVQIANNFTFSGSAAGATAINGAAFTSFSDMSQITITNTGALTAGGMGDVGNNSNVGNNYNSSSNVGGNADNGLAIVTGGTLSTVAITNNGSITAGNIGNISNSEVGNNYTGAVGGNTATGIAIDARNGISGLTLENAGLVRGGSVGTLDTNTASFGNNYDGPGDAGGSGATGVAIASSTFVSQVTFTNSGTIAGGSIVSLGGFAETGNQYNSASAGGISSTGFALSALGDISNGTFVNQGAILAGSITGSMNSASTTSAGNNYAAGAAGGAATSGVVINSAGSINQFSFTNTGRITAGGIGGMGQDAEAGNNFDGNAAGGNASTGVAISSLDGITGLSISNPGSITAGSIGNIDGANAGSNFTTAVGGNLATGLSISAGNDGITGLTISTQGSITGGNLGNITGDSDIGANFNSSGAGGNAAVGVAISTEGGISNLTFSNSGLIRGGNIGNVNGDVNLGGDYSGNSAVGGNDAVGVAINSFISIVNLSVYNSGTIAGGNIGTVTTTGSLGGDVGTALLISSKTGGNNFISVTNYGVIAGGNAGAGAHAGYGIDTNTGNVTINNWGAISVGSGTAGTGINLQFSTNNTVNLNGHSTVNGLITATDAGNTNILNLNFTGLSPAAITALRNQLLAQGIPLNTGVSSSGTFTVRGVTYTYDPLVVNLNASSYQVQGLTPNQKAIGAGFDNVAVSPAPGTPLFALFNAIDASGNVPGALDALSPQKFQIYGDLAIENTTDMVQNVDRRLNNLRDGSESIDTSGLGGETTVGTLATGDASKDGDSSKESKQVVQAAPTPNRWGFFATGDGLFFRGNPHDADMQQGKSNTAGTLVGIDGKVGDHAVIGAFGAYNNSAVDLGTDGSHATIDSYTGGLYGSYHQDGFYLNSLAAYTRNNYTSNRNILFPGFAGSAAGSTHGSQYSANIDGGYDWHLTDRLTAGPLAGVQYVHLDVNGFNELGGSGANLGIGEETMNSLQSRVGGRIDYHLLTTATSSSAIELYAAWQHEYLDDSRTIGASFTGTGLAPFGVQTASPKRDAAVVGAAVNFSFHNRLTLFADYELQLWSQSYFEQSVNGGAKISF